MREIYQPIERPGGPIVYTSRRSSEMIKYAANVFLAMKVTFINEIADLCERLDADVLDVSRGIGLDDRIGARLLNPGPGFGGSCFPKDTLALTRLANEAKAPIRLIETLVEVNDKRKVAMARKVEAACDGSVAGKRIAVLGLTYKPKTDDMRDAPSLVIVPELQAAGANVVAYNPEGIRMARPLLPGVTFVDNAYACVEGADAAVVITEWDEFRALDLHRVKAALASAVGCEVGGEASAGGGIGQPSSRERFVIPGADDVPASEGETDRRDNRENGPAGRGLRPWHVLELLARKPGDLLAIRRRSRRADRVGKATRCGGGSRNSPCRSIRTRPA